MKVTRAQVIALLTVLCSPIIALLINIITSNLPPWISSHLWLAWLLLLFPIAFLVVTAIRGSAEVKSGERIDDDLLNHFVQIVSDAESKTQLDPSLESIPYAIGKLAEWKDLDTRLIRILGIHDDKEEWQPQKGHMQLSRLVLRLTKAIIPSMTQRGQWKDLIELASPTFIIATTLKEWVDATTLAYELASTCYDAGASIKAKFWIDQMEKSLKHIPTQAASDKFSSKLFDIKGILLRDFDGDLLLASKYLKEALIYAKRTRDSLMIWRVTTHLGTLEKRNHQFSNASELYKEALAGALQLKDSGLILECYQELGDIAMLEGRADEAFQWYTEQLHLATNTSRVIYKGRAHKGLAESLLKMSSSDARQAYQHARESLRIEQEITGPKETELLILLIHIADLLWIQT